MAVMAHDVQTLHDYAAGVWNVQTTMPGKSKQ